MKNLIPLDILGHADSAGAFRRSRGGDPGLAAFGTLVDNLRNENKDGLLLLDCGDEIDCRYWPGKPVLDGLKLIGTDCFTLGNHEFDRGKEGLDRWISQAQFPMLCANVIELNTGKRPEGLLPYCIFERNGVKVGVLGLTTEYTPKMVTASSFEGYQMTSAVEACHKYLPQMQAEGAQVLVVVAHMPFYINDDQSVWGELLDLMHDIPKIDVLIGGHIPGEYCAEVEETAICKGGFSFTSLPHVRLWFDPEQGKVVKKECRLLHPDPDAPVNPVYKAFADEICAPFEVYLGQKVAHTDRKWVIHLSSETPLGNYLADCMRRAAGTEICYMNATSAGSYIDPGDIYMEDILRITGFNDPIQRSEITGAQLYQLFELVHVPERYGNNAGLFFSGIHVYMDHTKPAWQKVLKITLPDGSPVELDRKYTVASSEYMASGGNDTSAVANQLVWTPLPICAQDNLRTCLSNDGDIRLLSEDQRMYEIGRPENDNSPF